MFGGFMDVILTVLAWLYIAAGQPIPGRIKTRLNSRKKAMSKNDS